MIPDSPRAREFNSQRPKMLARKSTRLYNIERERIDYLWLEP